MVHVYQLLVRMLTGASTQYQCGRLNNCDSLWLTGYYVDPTLAECNIGDVMLLRVSCGQNTLDCQTVVVANPTTTTAATAAGLAVPVTNVAATWVPCDPPILVAKLPDTVTELTIGAQNAHSGAQLTTSASGATRALCTLAFKVTTKERGVNAGYSQWMRNSDLQEALGRFMDP
jgi:hypothetical protein